MTESSVPVQLLFEAKGCQITAETLQNAQYTGTLVNAEDNLNICLKNVQKVDPSGVKTHETLVFLRGSDIKLFSLPDILERSPVLRRDVEKGLGRSVLDSQ